MNGEQIGGVQKWIWEEAAIAIIPVGDCEDEEKQTELMDM